MIGSRIYYIWPSSEIANEKVRMAWHEVDVSSVIDCNDGRYTHIEIESSRSPIRSKENSCILLVQYTRIL